MATRDQLDQLIRTVIQLTPGTYLILRTDGEAVLVNEKATIAAVRQALSTPGRRCDKMDSITLKIAGAGSKGRRIVMIVDDTGMLDNLPTNSLAFHVASTIQNYPHDIHGTAVIVNDADFGPAVN